MKNIQSLFLVTCMLLSLTSCADFVDAMEDYEPGNFGFNNQYQGGSKVRVVDSGGTHNNPTYDPYDRSDPRWHMGIGLAQSVNNLKTKNSPSNSAQSSGDRGNVVRHGIHNLPDGIKQQWLVYEDGSTEIREFNIPKKYGNKVKNDIPYTGN